MIEFKIDKPKEELKVEVGDYVEVKDSGEVYIAVNCSIKETRYVTGLLSLNSLEVVPCALDVPYLRGVLGVFRIYKGKKYRTTLNIAPIE